MSPQTKASVRRIAVLVGVSRATVSRALRGAPRVSAATRTRVVAAARAAGYCLNPAASIFMSQIRRGRVMSYRGKIAWLNPGEDPRMMDKAPWLIAMHQGVRQRAEQTGYLIEDVWLRDPTLNPSRLTTVLRARGIQGLMIPSYHPHLTRIKWELFACVTMNSLLMPPFHLAGPDLIDGVRRTMAQLRRRGYARIGLMLHPLHDGHTEGMERAAYLLETASLPPDARVPILLSPENVATSEQVADFGRWVRQHRPDVVMCCDENVVDWARALGLDVPGELGLVNLGRHPHLTHWAGMDQREDQIGAAAVDLVVGQLVHGELGIPPFQKEVLVKGEWVEGPTIRPPDRKTKRTRAATTRLPLVSTRGRSRTTSAADSMCALPRRPTLPPEPDVYSGRISSCQPVALIPRMAPACLKS